MPTPTPTSSALGHALLIVGDRWNLQIIRGVFAGAHRFQHLRDSLHISDTVLAHRLGHLVSDGILVAVQYSTAPPRSEYRLTAAGKGLWPVYVALWNWDRSWSPRAHQELGARLRHSPCDNTIVPIFGCGACGAIGLTARDVRTEVDARLLLDVADRRGRRTTAPPDVNSTGVLADRWSTFLLAAALNGTRRFTDFQEQLGAISPATLTQRLSRFVDGAMLDRVPVADGARRQEYRLTLKGIDFFPVFATLNTWSQEHLALDGQSGLSLIHRACGAELRPRYTCNACNVELTRREIQFER
ncbi:winged helix-turn-helix transcriptional regulator [Tomitella biformata]|uniref:winged helix-turn-helix transcriptional regulator n=1 Tax=Tomitella biformata TaxID=630403 RepID=UPI000467D02D|nr:helix-turn-helix domain-containing protein [Tomitella biformata]